MLRTDLIEKLELVSPALSQNDLVPVLKHFWFLDDMLCAYNDQIAIETKLNSGFVGAVPSTLLQLLSVSRAKEVEFPLSANGELTIKAASSKFKLPFLPEKAMDIFVMPHADKKHELKIDIPEFVVALESCSRSLKEDTSMPDSLGITLIFDKEGFVDLYATNDATISTARVKLKQAREGRCVISGNFCRALISMAKQEGAKYLEIGKDYSLFQTASDSLFGRLVDVQRPLDFEGAINASFPAEAEKNLVSIPSKLELILDRAIVITDSKQDRPRTEITVEGGIAKFFSKSEDRGEVRDSVQVPDHPEVIVAIDPRLFKAGWGAFDKFTLTEKCLVMSKGSNLYLVSASH